MKILAVDDDPLFLDVLQAVLASIGQRDVTLAGSAVEAAKIIGEAEPPFDCCFIDIRMPEIEGDYLCKWVRRLPRYRDKTIVMITAKTAKADIDRAFAAGASDYLTKPLDFAELIDRVKLIEHRLLRAEQSGQKAAPAADDGAPTVEFSQPLALDEVTGAIELSALENYLLQLSLSQSHQMTAIAFKIVDAVKLHLTCTPEEYIRVLQTVARVILKTLNVSTPFISYAGYGAFVCVADDRRLSEVALDAFEPELNQALQAAKIAGDDGRTITVEMCASPPLKLGLWSGRKVVDAMYRTIGDAEARCSIFRMDAITKLGNAPFE